MESQESSDSELVAACLAGDPASWRAIVERYSGLVCSVGVGMGLAPADVDDIHQETFVKLLHKLHTVRDRDRIGLWLAATARRAALDLLRRGPRKRESQLDEHDVLPDASPLAVDELIRLEHRHRLHAAIAELSERCRGLLLGLFFRDPPATYRQLSEELGIVPNSLGPTRSRCFESLRRALARGAGPPRVRTAAADASLPQSAATSASKRSRRKQRPATQDDGEND